MASMYSEDMMEDVEMKLEELYQHSEATQLEMLTCEIGHMYEHGIQPSQEWFQERFLKVYQYSELNWRHLNEKYHFHNPSLAEQAERIEKGLATLVEQWSVSPIFDLDTYYTVLHEMNQLWKYYEAEYVDENHDEEVSDLISSMKHL
jgi:hypothetical protein